MASCDADMALGYLDPRRPYFTNSGPVYNPGRSSKKQRWDWPIKLIAVLSLLEFVCLRPFIIHRNAEAVDFIGFVLCHSVLVSLPPDDHG